MTETPELSYVDILSDLKNKIQIARQKAAITVNSQLLSIYWEIGNTILKQQQQEGWGTKIIERLSSDLKKEFPDIKGFSVRNIKYMRSFAEAWPSFPFVQARLAQLSDAILQQPAAKLASSQSVQPPVAQIQNTEKQDGIFVQAALAQISWYHHITLLEKIKDPDIREFYIQKTIQNGWSRDVMAAQIRSKLHLRVGNAITNFDNTMPPFRSDLARQTLKNPYLLDFIDLREEIRERDLEWGLLQHLKQFLLELGRGFAYVGNQFNLTVENDEFFLDLLFFNFHLNCFVVFELKVGEFKPEFAGKLNFYINCIDEQIKGKDHQPTIGVLLCKTPNQTIVKYSLKSIATPIGVADYELRKSLPKKLARQMPTVQELEEQLEATSVISTTQSKSHDTNK